MYVHIFSIKVDVEVESKECRNHEELPSKNKFMQYQNIQDKLAIFSLNNIFILCISEARSSRLKTKQPKIAS